MQNLNPHGNRKEISREVKRDIKLFEEKYIKLILCNPAELLKIYETENSNWNLFLMQDNKFLSIPKTDKECAPSFFGDIRHAEKYHEFINL